MESRNRAKKRILSTYRNTYRNQSIKKRTMSNPKESDKEADDNIDFGYSTVIVGCLIAAILIIIMFTTSGQV